jgi:two-component system OmpR family sensor kinase
VDITVGPGAVLTVRDRGRGLPEDTARSLFDPFWRGPDAAPGGTGLGLAIVERVQRAQGGTVEARTAPGGGAAFVLGWPSPDP